MRLLYETEWQGIPFASFTEVSSTKVADAKFYDAFYRVFFQKYASYDSLDFDWQQVKKEIADWMAESLPDHARVLSVGCGLGYMEQRLWSEYGDRIDLHVQDVASESLRWLRQVLPTERIHEAGNSQSCESPDEHYDLIYLSAVDYALSDEALVALMSELKNCLRTNGQIMILSASFLDESIREKVIHSAKDVAKAVLGALGLYKRGQLWGWMRSRTEYRTIMRAAGMYSLTDGFIETAHQRSYWIRAFGSLKHECGQCISTTN
jgi:ubiquinone/menaquinone biosynthesis C-methylase UbiE